MLYYIYEPADEEDYEFAGLYRLINDDEGIVCFDVTFLTGLKTNMISMSCCCCICHEDEECFIRLFPC